MIQNRDAVFKICIFGDGGVGKTTLVNKYLTGLFKEDMRMTIGTNFYRKNLDVENKKVSLQIWDFGGEERFRFLLHQYCKGANAALFLYDITNRLTLEHLPDWTQIIRKHSGDIPIMLVGNKLHLEEFRAVPRNEGIKLAEKYNLSAFAEISARTGQNVDLLFETVTEILLSPESRPRHVIEIPEPEIVEEVPEDQ